MTNEIRIYPTPGQFDDIDQRTIKLGLRPAIPANINMIAQQLAANGKPTEKERKLWKALKEARSRQAKWRGRERELFIQGVINQEALPGEVVSRASTIYVGLKERKCSYGDYVFNFAIPKDKDNPPQPIILPNNLPKILWKLSEQAESVSRYGIRMLRVDAIRQPDSSIKIIELNPCWVDNLSALKSFYETYKIAFPGGSNPVDLLIQNFKKAVQPADGFLCLAFCEKADGCRKDEIYGLAENIRAIGNFPNVVVSPLRDIWEKDGVAMVKNVPLSALYLNGSFAMAGGSLGEKTSASSVQDLVNRRKLIIAPAQFSEFDNKRTLCELSKLCPDLFLPTSSETQDLPLPVIAKPCRAESLMGVKVIQQLSDIAELPPGVEYVYQSISTSTTSGLVCFNSKTRELTKPSQLYEKINLWIIENQVAGVLATYSTTPLISDSGYNLPLKWREI